MAEAVEDSQIVLPELPVKHDQFIRYVTAERSRPMIDLLVPFNNYDAELRKAFAQQPDHPALAVPNVVPVYAGSQHDLTIRARKLQGETAQEKASYIMPLDGDDRLADGTLAIAPSLKDFQTNLSVFSESALVDLDWSNVVAAGSSVVTSLLAVPEKHASSKRALRDYYHKQLAPASDVDLFLYGLTEKQALVKVKQIEDNIRGAILSETTTIRTKNAITIASQHPTRHVQIVLRIYKSISEILTGFDVDCSCAAYDGQQVYASPRALAAYMTQINHIDLSRRSPSYENRLSKYARRGFEVYWPKLDRTRIDPTIFERSFGRTQGLARLLILEKLPNDADRIAYLDQRREERGRPAAQRLNLYAGRDNLKAQFEDEVAEWAEAQDSSGYDTFTIPYGPRYHARKIEKLLYTKDLLLNSEWNLPKERKNINLHRHPAFFGRVDDVIQDCCGSCPQPTTVEEEELAEEESKTYVSGPISFMKDDPGRQAIGSFNPITVDDWTDMAYIGDTHLLCQAIVDQDVDYVRTWLEQDGNDANTRDYTGRTPLHLAVTDSSIEIVQLLIDHGARIIARLVDGRTALHLAAARGNVEMVTALMLKSEANEEIVEEKLDAKRAASRKTAGRGMPTRTNDDTPEPSDDDGTDAQRSVLEETDTTIDDSVDIELIDKSDEGDDVLDATTENSLVNIRTKTGDADGLALADSDEDEPDVYDVNVVSWDTATSPLHLAIANGHIAVVEKLVQDFGADVLLPIKLFNDYDKSARAAILVLVLAMQLPIEQARKMVVKLVELGASTAQGDLNQSTALHFAAAHQPDMLETLKKADQSGYSRALSHLCKTDQYAQPLSNPLITAIQAKDVLTALQLLYDGAKPSIDFKQFAKIQPHLKYVVKSTDAKINQNEFLKLVEQPVMMAAFNEVPGVAIELVERHNVDVNVIDNIGARVLTDTWSRNYHQGKTVLDVVRAKIKKLSSWKHKSTESRKPYLVEDDAHYLRDVGNGTYHSWSIERQIKAAREQYDIDIKKYVEEVKPAEVDRGVKQKRTAIRLLTAEYQTLEKLLIKRGARTFKELHPDISSPANNQRDSFGYGHADSAPKPFTVSTSFDLGDLTDERRDRYLQLFEAAWRGDAAKVEELTSTTWRDGDDELQPPLMAAVKDSRGMSPFTAALAQGHNELAASILEIVQAQYVPAEQDRSKRLKVGDDEDDEGSECYDSEDEAYGIDDGDAPRVRSEFVDEQFTHDNIGEVSLVAKSRITALEVLNWAVVLTDFVPSTSLKHLSAEKRKTIADATSAIQLALYNDDSKLLKFLLAQGEKYTKTAVEADDDDAVLFYSVSNADYLAAIRLDKPHLLAELIRQTGSGLPINQLVEQSGSELQMTPRHYQGLSVYGKKRKDWAAAARNEYPSHGTSAAESVGPPLLEAARSGSLETVEWLLTDAPVRCYKQFAQVNGHDKRIKHLEEMKGGLETVLDKFLKARPELAMHCCLIGESCPEQNKVLEFLLKQDKCMTDAKNSEGITPLHVAFELYREEAAKVLIKAGADQTSRDTGGKNIVHHLLRRNVNKQHELDQVAAMLALIDERVISSLLQERTSIAANSETPVSAWINTPRAADNSLRAKGLRLLLKYAKGNELNMVNGDGNTPLQQATRREDVAIAAMILKHDPTLLNRESATGRTPYETAQDARIEPLVTDPPSMPPHHEFALDRAEQRRLATDWKHDMDKRQAAGFDPKIMEEKRTEKSDGDRLWDLFTKTKERLESERQWKRRLVSLNEANEVARRLAEGGGRIKKRGYRARLVDGHGDGEEGGTEDEADKKDEVQLWLEMATRSP